MQKPRDSLWHHFIVACLTVACLFLAWQNFTIKRRLTELYEKTILLPEAGDRLPEVAYSTLGGDSLFLDYRDPNIEFYLLAVFAPHCPGCERAFPLWGELRAELPEEIQFLALTDGVQEAVHDIWLLTFRSITKHRYRYRSMISVAGEFGKSPLDPSASAPIGLCGMAVMKRPSPQVVVCTSVPVALATGGIPYR